MPRESLSAYGIVDGTPVREGVYLIENLVEKPTPETAPSQLAIIGRYILTQDVFDILECLEPGHGAEIQLTDALKRLRRKRPIYGVCFQGKRYGAGDKLGYLIANVEFALGRDDLGPAFLEYIRSVGVRG